MEYDDFSFWCHFCSFWNAKHVSERSWIEPVCLGKIKFLSCRAWPGISRSWIEPVCLWEDSGWLRDIVIAGLIRNPLRWSNSPGYPDIFFFPFSFMRNQTYLFWKIQDDRKVFVIAGDPQSLVRLVGDAGSSPAWQLFLSSRTLLSADRLRRNPCFSIHQKTPPTTHKIDQEKSIIAVLEIFLVNTIPRIVPFLLVSLFLEKMRVSLS